MWGNVESRLVYANKLFWIAQSYFSTDIIKRSLTKLKKINCFIDIVLAKHCWIIKSREFKGDQKYFAR